MTRKELNETKKEIIDKILKYKSPSYPTTYYMCGLDYASSKYKEDCYFYNETNDMGAKIRFCTRKEIEWGYCPCEKCDHFLSKEEADIIIRSALNKTK